MSLAANGLKIMLFSQANTYLDNGNFVVQKGNVTLTQGSLSVAAGTTSRCIECQQPYYRNRYYRRQFESLVQSVLDSFRRERRRRDRRRFVYCWLPDVKAAIDGKQPNLTSASNITTGTINANGDLVVSNGGVYLGNSSHGIRQADNSVEVHTAGGSGDIRLLTATGIGLEVQPNRTGRSIRFSAYRAIQRTDRLDTLNSGNKTISRRPR
jgi:hypothetical protein